MKFIIDNIRSIKALVLHILCADVHTSTADHLSRRQALLFPVMRAAYIYKIKLMVKFYT